jgi:nitrite reductase/ring-hydroxylating ferredoxin subunit
MAWHRIANRNDLPEGSGGEFVAGGRVVALYHVDATFHALDGVCPHAGGPLGLGTLNGTVVTCPWHGWQFDVCTGESIYDRGRRIATYRASVVGDDVLVEV